MSKREVELLRELEATCRASASLQYSVAVRRILKALDALRNASESGR